MSEQQQRPGIGPYPYQYPPSSSSLNLPMDNPSYKGLDAPSIAQEQKKKHWKHKELHTAFGSISVAMFLKKKYIKYHIILLIIIVLVILMTVYHHQIVRWFEPKAEKIKDIPAGWLIFVGIIFVISWPPLFGHEIVGLLIGIIYGLWAGFGILALGTLLGELSTYWAFKACLKGRAEKLERDDLNYACMVRVVHEGGWKVVFLARLSVIPGHLTTPVVRLAIFATCGLSFWTFLITTVVTLPKQLEVVYLGTMFDQESEGKSTTTKIVSYSVLAAGFLVTVAAAWYIYRLIGKWRPVVMEERALRDGKAFLAADASFSTLDSQMSDPDSETQQLTRHAQPIPYQPSSSLSLSQNHAYPFAYGTSTSPYTQQPHSDPSLLHDPYGHGGGAWSRSDVSLANAMNPPPRSDRPGSSLYRPPGSPSSAPAMNSSNQHLLEQRHPYARIQESSQTLDATPEFPYQPQIIVSKPTQSGTQVSSHQAQFQPNVYHQGYGV